MHYQFSHSSPAIIHFKRKEKKLAATTFHPKKNGGKIRKLQHKCGNHESVRNFVTKDTAFKHSVNLKLKFGKKSKKIGRV